MDLDKATKHLCVGEINISRRRRRDAPRSVFCKEFATQITLNVNNMWGIIKMLVDLLLDKEDGKYVIARDGLKPLVRIYAVPPNTFEGDDSEDDDEVVQEEDSESD